MLKKWEKAKVCAALLAGALLFGTAAGCGGPWNMQAESGQRPDGEAGGAAGEPAAVSGGAGGTQAAGNQTGSPADIGGTAETGLPPEAAEGFPAPDGGDFDPAPGDPAAGKPGEPGEPARTHYMNKNYFLKPIDEDGDKRVVLLTFDDGPKEEGMLADMLDTLDEHGAKAIFFVNGFRVAQNPDFLRLIDERGHSVGNHSWDHIVLKNEPEDVIDRQLEDVQEIVEQTIGKRPRFFRPPNGAGNDYVKEKAAGLGMLYMTWSNGSLDWADNQHDPDGVIRSVMDQLRPGCIILMHELSWTAEALDELLTRIEAEGYSFLDPEAIDFEAR